MKQSIGRTLRAVVTDATDAQAPAKAIRGLDNAVLGRVETVAAGAWHDFAKELQDLLAAHPEDDIVLLSEGADLPYAWDIRLQKAVQADSRIAVAVPMCDASPLHALVDREKHDVAARTDAVDRAAYCLGRRSFYEAPAVHAVCAYVRREALEAALPFIERGLQGPRQFLHALTRYLRSRGWSSVVCDYLYVGYGGDEQPLIGNADGVEASAFARHHPLGAVRRAVNQALEEGLPAFCVPGLDPRPVQLHIMHYWGGGSDKWVRDFGRADESRINMVLASYRIGDDGGQRIVLHSDPSSPFPIRTWDLAQPIRATVPSSLEYRRILEEVVREFHVEAIVVSSLIGHSLEALSQPLPTVIVCHDFYPVCQAINPQFNETCRRCTLEDLRRCAASNPLNTFFPGHPAEEWHAMRSIYAEHIVERGIRVVAPSPSVAETLRRIEPRLEATPIEIIEHGTDFEPARLSAPRVDPHEPLRIVIPGRLIARKGATLLREAAEGLRGHARITLLGCGEEGVELAKECGWDAIERYRHDELAELMRAIRPHAGLLPSVVPETFSYTLSELWALGIPPIATRLGSFRDRIEDERTGFLFEPDARALVELVRALQAKPARLQGVAATLATRDAGRSVAQMVGDYHALIPLAQRPVARFTVGIGAETALTEPYRHLEGAYAHLNGAYSQLSDSYAHLNEQYEKLRQSHDAAYSEYEKLRGEVWKHVDEDWRAILAMQLRSHWWRAPEVPDVVARLREKIAAALAAPQHAELAQRFPWADGLFPSLLKSPWWIGHIPFAFEMVARLRPATVVELGTYSGSSFAAFCQAVEACGLDAKCYGVDLWEGDIHMGTFDEALFREIANYLDLHYPRVARLLRKDFNQAVHDFADGSVDLLHIDGTHTYEAVSNDFNTWLPKMSETGVVLFHDVNVTVENAGPKALQFGVRRFFDEVKRRYPHCEFPHCWGLGVLVVGRKPREAALELVTMSGMPAVTAYFAFKGGQVSRRFEEMDLAPPVHATYGAAPVWQRAVNKVHRYSRRILDKVKST